MQSSTTFGHQDPRATIFAGIFRVAAVGAAAIVAQARPAAGMCRDYTDRSRSQGFWDYCPR